MLTAALIFSVLAGTVFSAAPVEMNMTVFEEKLASFKRDVYANGSRYKDNAEAYRGTECYGFANQIAQYFYGSFPTYDSTGRQPYPNWTVTYGSAALETLHVGDVVRYRSSTNADHSIFITGFDDNLIYFSDANNDHNNTVRHNASMTWAKLTDRIDRSLKRDSSLTGWVAHYKYWNDNAPEDTGTETEEPDKILTVSYNANGGYAEGVQTHVRYVVLTYALRMRSGPGLDAEILTRMKSGTYFDVAVGAETVEADGYVWAPVTQGSLQGWAAVSDPEDCRIDSPVMSCDYYVNDAGDICASGTPEKYTQVLTEGAELAGNGTFGLKRGGAEFAGWSETPDGETVTAEELAAKYGEADVTLYAIWRGGEETGGPADEETTEPEETQLAGDVNGDGKINNKDVARLFRLICDSDGAVPGSCDVNGDGTVNNKDIVLLFRMISDD
ncbi:MAG: dockerin type I repeat-containing protein [Clostridia bacterium]|nr:dockerin type I repeat-containing protein [Clostridia bacterium]